MKQVSQFLKTTLRSLFEYMLFFPVILLGGILLDHYLNFSLLIWIMLIPLTLIIGIVYRTIIQTNNWWAYLGMALLIGFMPVVFLPLADPVTWLLCILLPIVTFRGMLYASRDWLSLLPIYFLWTGGFLIYFVAYFVFYYVDLFSPYTYLITIGGALLVITTIFISNSERLRKSTLEKEKTPYISGTIKRQNKMMLLLTIILIIIGSLSVVQQGFKAFIGFFVRLIFTGEEGEIEEIPEENFGDAPGGLILPGDGEPNTSKILKFLEVITIYLMYIGFIVAAIFLVLLFMKKGRQWMIDKWHACIQFLRNLTQRFSKEKKAPYIDEKETIFDWKTWKQKQQDHAKALMNKVFRRKPNWNALSDNEKVRYLYRHLVQKQMKKIDYTPALTPRETLNGIKKIVETRHKDLDLLRKYYEEVRYGKKDMDFGKTKDIYTLIENIE